MTMEQSSALAIERFPPFVFFKTKNNRKLVLKRTNYAFSSGIGFTPMSAKRIEMMREMPFSCWLTP